MNVVVALIAFAIVLIAELPDKTMFASLVLGTRFSPRWVFLGVATAFLVHVSIAVSAGSLLALAPRRVLELIIATLFLAGAALMLHASAGPDDEPEVEEEPGAKSSWGVAAASFGVVFIGEWGDITQIATANLAAKYHDPLAVGIGAVLGLWAAALLAITLGKSLLRYISVTLLHRVGAVIFLGFAVFSFVKAFR
jgi:putative Ca2+/H+ antiporter (TMEM165/GDT1 family)